MLNNKKIVSYYCKISVHILGLTHIGWKYRYKKESPAMEAVIEINNITLYKFTVMRTPATDLVIFLCTTDFKLNKNHITRYIELHVKNAIFRWCNAVFGADHL